MVLLLSLMAAHFFLFFFLGGWGGVGLPPWLGSNPGRSIENAEGLATTPPGNPTAARFSACFGMNFEFLLTCMHGTRGCPADSVAEASVHRGAASAASQGRRQP